MKILDIGCGKNKYKSACKKDKVIGLDVLKLPGVDVVHNLEKFPWPFKNNEFNLIICNHVLEHLDNTVKVMEELWRIGKPNAIIKINVPFFAYYGAFQDPTHKRFFTIDTFEYFTEKNELSYYSKARFDIIKRKIGFFAPSIPRFISRIIEFFINLNQKFYQRFFAYIIPANNLYFELKIIK